MRLKKKEIFLTFLKCSSTIRKEKYLFRKRIKILNVAGFEHAPPGNRPGALTTELYVLLVGFQEARVRVPKLL